MENEIFADRVYLAFRIVENAGFVAASLLMVLIYGASIQASRNTYFGMGYAFVGFGIFLILNSLLRTIYLIFRKVE